MTGEGLRQAIVRRGAREKYGEEKENERKQGRKIDIHIDEDR